jgi:phthalate 4,5-dioxygenase
MFSAEDMASLVETDRGTPGGELMRCYWQPVALVEEATTAEPLPVTVLGEDLVLFRDTTGGLGLIDRYCPHRGTDLTMGWCEERGLRCMYHGWLFDREGRCLEQPAEPAKSRFQDRVRTRAYPCVERSGIVFSYLGPVPVPLFPDYEFLSHPDDQVWVTKVFHDCNYLQGNEGNLDQTHIGILHKIAPDTDAHEGIKSSAPGSSRSPAQLTAEDLSPRIETERTDFGFREYTTRRAPEGTYLKIQSFVLPNLAIFPGAVQGKDGHQAHWHVPIDDSSHWKYVLVFQRQSALDKESLRRSLLGDGEIGRGYRAVRTRANHYLQDREVMSRYPGVNGLGPGFEIHDMVAVESQGRIQDRSREHLGYGDKSVIALRRTMLAAIEQMRQGNEPPHVLRTPDANHLEHLEVIAEVVPEGVDVRDHLKRRIEDRRSVASQS